MSIALFSAVKLFAAPSGMPLTSLLAWFWRTRNTSPAIPATRKKTRISSSPPLRVWRYVDSSARGSAGTRLRISGRMSEVCAELDRLAELEARQG